MSKEIELNLSKLANGAIQEKLDGELKSCLKIFMIRILLQLLSEQSLLS